MLPFEIHATVTKLCRVLSQYTPSRGRQAEFELDTSDVYPPALAIPRHPFSSLQPARLLRHCFSLTLRSSLSHIAPSTHRSHKRDSIAYTTHDSSSRVSPRIQVTKMLTYHFTPIHIPPSTLPAVSTSRSSARKTAASYLIPRSSIDGPTPAPTTPPSHSHHHARAVVIRRPATLAEECEVEQTGERVSEQRGR